MVGVSAVVLDILTKGYGLDEIVRRLIRWMSKIELFVVLAATGLMTVTQ